MVGCQASLINEIFFLGLFKIGFFFIAPQNTSFSQNFKKHRWTNFWVGNWSTVKTSICIFRDFWEKKILLKSFQNKLKFSKLLKWPFFFFPKKKISVGSFFSSFSTKETFIITNLWPNVLLVTFYCKKSLRKCCQVLIACLTLNFFVYVL